ncbi:MAG: hypothetical protein J6V50_04705 [Clostridia bacterium]|nr:hypothetical protein [Clostridia bacterium]
MSDSTFNPTEKQQEIAERIINIYKEFKVKIGPFAGIAVGERVTRYEFNVAPTEKLSRILKYKDDISLMLSLPVVRIVFPICGTERIGIELQNEEAKTVKFDEVYSSLPQAEAYDNLPLVLGRALGGENIIQPLSRAPHILIGGEEFSGKTALVKNMLLSLLLSTDPKDVKVVLITNEPEKYSVFEGESHFMCPTIREKHTAYERLRDLYEECLERLSNFKVANVKSLKDYNDKNLPKKLPKIVVIIDDFSEFLPYQKKAVEQYVLTLAQVGRAAAMHLILSTKETKPTAVSGMLKANIPTRIALKCENGVKSRTILDEGGAENLIGGGDMLLSNVNLMLPVRIQSPTLTDQEIREKLNKKQ